MSIPTAFIQDLLQRVDIADVVGRYVPLKKNGANLMGLCPFHGEKSPSFSVSPSKQFFHCFGCGKSGDAIAFLREHTGMDFTEAVQSLAQEMGMALPESQRLSPQQRQQQQARQSQQQQLYALMEQAASAYRQQLGGSQQAIAYLKGRGLSASISQRYGLGYAPAGWNFLSSVVPDYTSALLVQAGLVIQAQEEGGLGNGKRYDRFRQRIMFPIRDTKGQCIAFGGRVLGDDKPKYLNSPETPLFHKGRELYGLFEARAALREAGYALVCEGYMDVVALAQLGFANAVATLGTACTPEHVHKLYRFTESIVFSFDGDEAGRRAAAKALEAVLPHLNDQRSAKFLFLPAEHDPDSYIRAHGADAFARLVHAAQPFNVFLQQLASEGCDLGTAPGRARMASQALPLWDLLPQGMLKQLVLQELAAQVDVSTSSLLENWQHSAHAAHSRTQSQLKPAPNYQAAGQQASHGSGNYSNSNGDTYANANEGKRRQHWGRFNRPRPLAPQHTHAPTLTTGADQAVRLLLSNMQLLQTLDNDDWDALVHIPAPHGCLFAWLEGLYQEQGAMPWHALQNALQNSPYQDWAHALMASAPSQPQDDAQAQHQELRSILQPWLKRRLSDVLNELAQAYANNPGDIDIRQRYQTLLARSRAATPPTR